MTTSFTMEEKFKSAMNIYGNLIAEKGAEIAKLEDEIAKKRVEITAFRIAQEKVLSEACEAHGADPKKTYTVDFASGLVAVQKQEKVGKPAKSSKKKAKK